MKVLVLAGGFGTRLKSVLPDLPKPLAPVNGRPFLEYPIGNFKRAGITDFILCTHFLSEKFNEHFGDGKGLGIRVDYSMEEAPLGTGGAVGLLRDTLKETFCVINGDNYIELDIRDFINTHRESKAVASIAAARVEDTSRYGRVEFDGTGRVISFREKNTKLCGEGYINAGFYLFEPAVFDYIPPNRNISLEREVFVRLLEDGKIVNSYSKVFDFFDIGLPSDYKHFVDWISSFKQGLE